MAQQPREDQVVAQSFVDLVQRKIDDKVLKAPHGEEGNRLKESVMYPDFIWGPRSGSVSLSSFARRR